MSQFFIWFFTQLYRSKFICPVKTSFGMTSELALCPKINIFIFLSLENLSGKFYIKGFIMQRWMVFKGRYVFVF